MNEIQNTIIASKRFHDCFFFGGGDSKGILFIDFLHRQHTTSAVNYCGHLRKSRQHTGQKNGDSQSTFRAMQDPIPLHLFNNFQKLELESS